MVAPVRRRADFDALSKSRARGRSGPIWVARAPVPADPSEPVRVAYAIPKAVGGAVVRNRLRRRLRPMIAELAAELPAGAYLVGARAGATELAAGELRDHLVAALAGAARPRKER